MPKSLKNQAASSSGWAHQNAHWLLDTPQILDAAQRLETDWVDRATVERLFVVKRRQALYLMAGMGSKPSGTSWMLPRSVLIEELTSILNSPGFEAQSRRREKVAQEIAAEKGRKVPIKIAPEDHRRTTLPDGVLLERNRLTVDFEDLPQLLTRLYGIASAMANNFEQFSSVGLNET